MKRHKCLSTRLSNEKHSPTILLNLYIFSFVLTSLFYSSSRRYFSSVSLFLYTYRWQLKLTITMKMLMLMLIAPSTKMILIQKWQHEFPHREFFLSFRAEVEIRIFVNCRILYSYGVFATSFGSIFCCYNFNLEKFCLPKIHSWFRKKTQAA